MMSGEESHNNNNNHGEGPSNKRVTDQMTMQEKKQLKIEAKAKAEHHMQVQQMFSYMMELVLFKCNSLILPCVTVTETLLLGKIATSRRTKWKTRLTAIRGV